MSKKLRVALICASPVAAVWGWSAAASALYLYSKGFGDAFEAPWLQWWIACRYAIQNGFPKTLGAWNELVWLTAGAGFPSLVLFGLARAWWGRCAKTPVYGQTDWASRKQMKANKISTTGRPF